MRRIRDLRPSAHEAAGASRPTIHRITNAPVALHDDQSSRVRNYVISMSMRIVFIVLAVFSEGVWRWTFAVCAVAIPYFAVVIANGGRERIQQATSLTEKSPESSDELPASASLPAANDTDPWPTPPTARI